LALYLSRDHGSPLSSSKPLWREYNYFKEYFQHKSIKQHINLVNNDYSCLVQFLKSIENSTHGTRFSDTLDNVPYQCQFKRVGLCHTPHSSYVTLCYFNHCQHKNHVTMVYHVIDSKLQPLFTTHTVSQ